MSFRSEIYQSKVMVAVALGLSLADSLATLQAHAFRTGRDLGAIAHDIVQHGYRLAEDRDEHRPQPDRDGGSEGPAMISTDQLATVFVRLADTLVDDFDAIDFLHDLARHAARVSGAEVVGVMLVDHHERLQSVASSNENGKLLELLQLQADEGPCIDCFISREPVVNADLATAGDRWQTFAPAARDAGFNSVHAFPMRLNKTIIGPLDLFGHPETHFDADAMRVVQALADVATIAILQERSATRAEAVTEQLHHHRAGQRVPSHSSSIDRSTQDRVCDMRSARP